MNRVFTAALIATALLLLSHRPASAMVEFCPAHLQYERVGDGASLIRQQSSKDTTGKSGVQTSSLYGLELTGFGPRTVTHATLTFETSGGWYSAEVPPLTLTEKDRHYTGPSSKFTLQDYVSRVFYVRFPHELTVNHGWVSSAATQGDRQFDWDKQGTVQCAPMPRHARVIALTTFNRRSTDDGRNALYALDAKDEDPLSAPPQSGSTIVAAKAASSLADGTCTTSFEFAAVRAQEAPPYPEGLRGYFGFTTVEIAIDASGKLADAWIWGPSGHTAFDAASLDAAEESTYRGGSAYCKPAPGYYFFRVEFEPSR